MSGELCSSQAAGISESDQQHKPLMPPSADRDVAPTLAYVRAGTRRWQPIARSYSARDGRHPTARQKLPNAIGPGRVDDTENETVCDPMGMLVTSRALGAEWEPAWRGHFVPAKTLPGRSGHGTSSVARPQRARWLAAPCTISRMQHAGDAARRKMPENARQPAHWRNHAPQNAANMERAGWAWRTSHTPTTTL